MDIDQAASILRELLRVEAEQADRRMSWLASLQGLLFAALAFAWEKSRRLERLLATVGVLVAILVFCGTLAGSMAVQNLRFEWGRLVSSDYEGPPAMGFYPASAPWSVYTSPENLLPLVFAAAWLVVIWLVKDHSRST